MAAESEEVSAPQRIVETKLHGFMSKNSAYVESEKGTLPQTSRISFECGNTEMR